LTPDPFRHRKSRIAESSGRLRDTAGAAIALGSFESVTRAMVL